MLGLGGSHFLGTLKEPLNRPHCGLVQRQDSGAESVLAHTHGQGLSLKVDVAEPPLGWYTFGREDDKQELAALKPLLGSLGAGGTADSGRLTFQTDEAPFLIHGVPSFVLWTPMDKYMLIHHKPSDTFDKVNERDLNLGAAVVGVTAYAFADAPAMIKHLSAAEVEEEFKSLNVLSQYQDLEEHKLF